jgi:PAS domain S-box-containing protein
VAVLAAGQTSAKERLGVGEPSRDPIPAEQALPPGSGRSAVTHGPSIGVRLVVLVLVALLPAAGVVLHLGRDWRAASEADAANDVRELAETAVVHQDNLLASTMLLLEALAATDQVRDPGVCSPFLGRIHEGRSEYGVIGVADAAGDFWCSSQPTETPISVADREYFRVVRATNAAAVGNYQIGYVTGLPVVAVAMPLKGPAGEFAGAVIASIHLSRPTLLAERLDLPEGSTLTVFDEHGTVLMRWPEGEGYIGRAETDHLRAQQAGEEVRLVGLDGVERIYGVASLHEDAGALTLTVGVPAAAVDNVVLDRLQVAVLQLAVIGLLGIAAAFMVGRWFIVRPTRRLQMMAQRLAGGDLSARSLPSGGGEFAELAHDLNIMATALEARDDALREAERRTVEERYRGLLEVAADAVVVTDAEGRIVLFNQGAEVLFGVPARTAIGSPASTILPEATTRSERTEACWTDEDGALRWVESTASPGSDGLTTVILRDVTAQHAAAAAAKALYDSQERFRMAQEHSAIGLAIVGLDGSWVDVNPALCDILGRTAEELKRLTFQDITHPDDLEKDLAEAGRLLSGESDGYEMEKRYLRPDGTIVWAQLNGTVVRDEERTPLYFVAQVQDLTERKRSQELLDVLFRSSPDLLSIAGFEGYFLRTNPAWSEQLGWSEEELLTIPFMEFVHPDDLASSAVTYEKLLAGESTVRRFENRFRTRDGAYRWLQWHAISMPELGLMVANARDVTDQKVQEAELAQRREELERSNTELEQFAYVASHDLSEPLRAISGFTALLEAELADDLPEAAQEYMGFITGGTARMQVLINDLLALSRVSRGAHITEPVELGSIVQDVRDALAATIRERGATIDVGGLPTVSANRTLVLQLLQNLIGNGLKFHRPDVSPVVRVRAADGPEGFSELIVEDNGIGIDEGYRDRVFRMFQRLHTRSEYPGTGMGLAICQKIVQSYGGDIWIEDSALGGTALHLTLPRNEETP